MKKWLSQASCKFVANTSMVFATAMALCLCSTISYADSNQNQRLKRHVDNGKLHSNILNKLEYNSHAEIIAIMDSTKANDVAFRMRNESGRKHDNHEIIKEKTKYHKSQKDNLLSNIKNQNIEVIEDYEFLPVIRIKADKTALEKIIDTPGVKYIGENTGFTRKLNESLPLVDSIVTHSNGFTGYDTSVAILDTGINYSLNAFGNCTSPGKPSACKVAYSKDFSGENIILDENGHGTNISGIIASAAPDTKIVSLKVFKSDGTAYESDVIRALQWVLANKDYYNIVAVNLSLGAGKYTSPCSNLPLAGLLSDLKNAGIAAVVASGNDGFSSAISYPACTPSAISVGAVYDSNIGDNKFWAEGNCTDTTTTADQVPCFSNSASFLTVLAPGSELTSAGTTMSGTSQASAYVSGVVAQLKSSESTLTVDETITRLTSTGNAITDIKNGIVKPRLNAYAALNNLPNAAYTSSALIANNSTTSATAAPSDTNGVASSPTPPAITETKNIPSGVTIATEPGWIMDVPARVSPEQAKRHFDSNQKLSASIKLRQGAGTQFGLMAATSASPEITELARSLQYDPKLIFDYVHNNIDYVPYYGSLKGATLTYLDGSGNDFDQASLMIALLRASGYSAQYVNGTMTIPGSQLANWGGVDQTQGSISTLFQSGSIPMTQPGSDGTATLDRVWVKATIGGTDYLFDPAFKTYTYTNKIDLGTAMNYSRTDFYSAATTGATVSTDYVQNMNEANIRSKLSSYSINLSNTIQSQYSNKSVDEIIGGRNLVQAVTKQYPASLPFSPATINYTWDEIPSNRSAKLRIQHVGIDYTFDTHDLSGKRLTISYAGSDRHPELRLDGNLVASGTATTLGQSKDCYVTINHNYPSSGYADQSVTYPLISGSNYSIIYNFGGVSDQLISKRQQLLSSYRLQGLTDTSEPVLGETLNIMGITWLKQVMMTNKLAGAIGDTIRLMHHNIGMVSQETGYYIDVKAAAGSIISKHNINSDANAHFKTGALFVSALEHGVLEQLMGSDKPATSTIKLLQLANSTGKKIYSANSTNFASIRPQLVNYTTSELDSFNSYIQSGYSYILPENAQIPLNNWRGEGYIRKYFSTSSSSMGMVIGGKYYGGYGSISGPVSTPTVSQYTQLTQVTTPTVYTANFNLSSNSPSKSIDPVDMAGGSFLVDNTDISIGGAAPLGLAFSRSYASANSFSKRNLGYGWGHNLDIYYNTSSHAEPAFGMRQPVDAASIISAIYVSFDLIKNLDDNASTWLAASLTSKWAVDQTIDNAVVINLGNKVMEFIKLPDSTYSSPPGITTKLVKNGDNTHSLVERFGTRYDFNSNKQLSSMTDVNGNTMVLTYSGSNLSSVRDAYNRTLTIGYDTNSRINSITDNSGGRSVSYGYDANNNLISYTDPESKVWGYGYNTNHLMTTLTNPLNIITATNEYDTFGRVKTQTVPRQGAPGTTATYNFFFSGWRNVEKDPSGNTTTYFYDRKGREYAVENALGQRSEKSFDGQDHIVLSTNPRLYSFNFQYDANHNLIKTIDPLSKETNNTYDTLFRLTDSTDTFGHTSHFEYDSKHHPILSRDAVGNQTSATYYANGLKYTATNGRGTATTFTYNSYGGPSTSTITGHPAINYNYDIIGRMTSLTDQVGSATTFVYDKRNLPKQSTDPLGRVTLLTYYDDGSLWQKTDRNGALTTYSYTPSGKIQQKSYSSGSPVNFTYNLLDQLTSMQDSIGTTNYSSYDAAGRLISFTSPYGFTISYAYDESGNLATLTYPGNKQVTYTYDALNRIKTVNVSWLNQTATYTYDDAGRLTGLTSFNGISTSYGYDNANRLTSINHPAVASYSFILDGNGNRTSVTQTEPLTANSQTGSTSYVYNTSKNRLLTAGANSFGYDYEGQLSSGYGSNYSFDNEHRLISAGNATYLYDGSGNRLQATRSGTITRYVYDTSGNLLAEADGNNTITRYYIHGAGLLAMATASNQIYNYHYNATGSTVAITDSNQAIINKYVYDPYGNIGSQVEAIPQPFKYVGQYGVMAEPNGFYYMLARYYDPQVGRFISEDPLSFGGGDVNLMAYVQNNPINFVDPEGTLPLYAIIPGVGGTINGAFETYNTCKNGCDFKAGAQAFGKGFAAGAAGTSAAFLLRNPVAAGAANGFVSNVASQYFAGTTNAKDLTVSTVTNAIATPFAKYLIPTVGRLPEITTWRTTSNWGLNSTRLVGQESLSSSLSGVVGSAFGK